MRVCIFDWNGGGHNPGLMLRFAEALTPDAEVVLAAPDRELEQVGERAFERYGLGDPRPRPARPGRYLRNGEELHKREMAREELEMIERACRETGADRLVLTYADPVLRWLAGWKPLPCPHSILVMKPRAHYRTVYRTRLRPQERLSALFQDRLVTRWRRRDDAFAVFTMDRGAAEHWSRRRGCKAVWLPDAPPSLPAPPPGTRDGCLIFGYLEPRKGVGLLAGALADGAKGMSVTIAGSPAPEYREQLEKELDQMRAGGVRIDAQLRRISDAEAAKTLASARCVVLPYIDHYGSSGVLAEAAALRTPVVSTGEGLLGHVVREYELGLTVDPTDAAALRAAILELDQAGSSERFAPGMRRYIEAHSPEAFARAARAGVGLA
ncbi:MAG TPA: glycosyltransferase [Solirubrobacterales bacterium]|nr:glycosyltransferase [Solirubrobacterales bacterium]